MEFRGCLIASSQHAFPQEHRADSMQDVENSSKDHGDNKEVETVAETHND